MTLLAAGAVGMAVFFVSLRGIDLGRMNGLGLISVLPAGALAGVALIAVAFMVGLALPRAHRVALGALLACLVICLDGITVFAEPVARFPTAFQIAGFVNYISTTGHTAPGLAAYFSWPGFFALISFVTGASGTHSILTLLRVWPTAIDLLCLAPFFLIMRNLRISWRAQWLAAFFFTVGNWVGQDYFSPQSFGYLLYLVFVAILVTWFIDPDRGRPLRLFQKSRLARLHRRIFGPVRPGEREFTPTTTSQKAFLFVLLVGIFTVTTVSHQLTPFFMLGAGAGLILTRRFIVPGLPILCGVILVGYFSFAGVGYWSGHLSNVFGGFGSLGANVSTSVGGRLTGSTPSHLIALHAKLVFAAVILGLAGLGLLRRRRRGLDDRVLLALLVMPVVVIGLVSYGGEIALRTYLFALPAASVFAALLFFPTPNAPRPNWRALAVLAACAIVLPASFYLARYGNEAFEQTPPGELAAANWVYAHDSHGVRLLWLSENPPVDDTPEMPWSYQDLAKVHYVPSLAPRNPENVNGLVTSLFYDGPGSYLIATKTQIASLQQTSSYPAGWGDRFESAMAAAPFVRIAYQADGAVVYTLDWSALSAAPPRAAKPAAPARSRYGWTRAGLIVFWLLLALLAAAEIVRLRRPSARTIKLLWLASMPLLVVLFADVILRFVVLS